MQGGQGCKVNNLRRNHPRFPLRPEEDCQFDFTHPSAKKKKKGLTRPGVSLPGYPDHVAAAAAALGTSKDVRGCFCLKWVRADKLSC